MKLADKSGSPVYYPILDEFYRIRDAFGRRYCFDVGAICDALPARRRGDRAAGSARATPANVESLRQAAPAKHQPGDSGRLATSSSKGAAQARSNTLLAEPRAAYSVLPKTGLKTLRAGGRESKDLPAPKVPGKRK